MPDLAYQDLVNIHELVRERFHINGGVRDPSTLDAISKRPSQGHFGLTPFPDVFLKAASIMEGIIRWSPFVDGNKRTALVATTVYLRINRYALVLPLSAVRFSVQIAQNKEDDPATTQRLLKRIAKWIQFHAANNAGDYLFTFRWHMRYPVKLLAFLLRVHLDFVARRILGYWLALDLNPQRMEDVTSVMGFLLDTTELAITTDESHWRRIFKAADPGSQ